MSEERAHSKFSASGSDRWLKCAASVALEEASPPSPSNPWAVEGTLAHSVLECLLLGKPHPPTTGVMRAHCERVVQKIKALHKVYGGKLLVEKRVYASYIHEEMFGTCDVVIAGNERTLHIIDFKYGQGHIVNPEENTQLLQYALSVAESYGWDEAFDQVKMWILQPRAGEDWHKSWLITIDELRTKWLPLWHKGVARVMKGDSKPFPGAHCHWCRAKLTCPAKAIPRQEKISTMFLNHPLPKEGKDEQQKARTPHDGQKETGKKENSKQGGRQSPYQKSKSRESEKENEEESFY